MYCFLVKDYVYAGLLQLQSAIKVPESSDGQGTPGLASAVTRLYHWALLLYWNVKP